MACLTVAKSRIVWLVATTKVRRSKFYIATVWIVTTKVWQKYMVAVWFAVKGGYDHPNVRLVGLHYLGGKFF